MKKNFLMLSCIAAIVTATVVSKKTFESHADETNNLLMQNVEALSQENKEGAICPSSDYVPNRYIVVSNKTEECTCHVDGEISIGGKLFKGSWKKNKTYTIVIITKNCDGVAEGACCDQNQVGITIA